MKYLLITLLFITNHFVILAQNSVSIGTEEINNNAVLQLVSQNNNQGFLVPRLTTSQRETMQLNSDDNGMLVFDIDQGYFFYWHSGVWFPLISNEIQNLSDVLSQGNDAGSAVITGLAEPINNTDASTKLYVDNAMNSSWRTTGNSGTTASTNYIGTSDNVDLHVKTNGTDSIVIAGANGNVNVTNNVNTAGEYQYNSDKDRYLIYSNAALIVNGAYQMSGVNNDIYAIDFAEGFIPVQLPQGATIRDVSFAVWDDVPGASITVQFCRRYYSAARVPDEIFFTRISTDIGYNNFVVNDIDHLVNDIGMSYWIKVTCSTPDLNIGFIGARIHYTVTQAD